MFKIFEIASRVSTPLAVTGIVVVAVFFVVRQILKKAEFSKPTRTHSFQIFKRVIDWFFVFGITALVLGFLSYGLTLVAPYWNRSELYHVSIYVLDAENKPVLDAKVISAPTGTQKKTDNGWEITIPEAALGDDKKLTVWATSEGGTGEGSNDIVLAADHRPSVKIILRRDLSARIKGRVTDEDGKPLSGAVVYIANHNEKKVTTDGSGFFDLAAHAAAGQHVHVFIEKENYQPWNDVIPAGGESLTSIALTKK
jgi:hypothetical protein